MIVCACRAQSSRHHGARKKRATMMRRHKGGQEMMSVQHAHEQTGEGARPAAMRPPLVLLGLRPFLPWISGVSDIAMMLCPVKTGRPKQEENQKSQVRARRARFPRLQGTPQHSSCDMCWLRTTDTKSHKTHSTDCDGRATQSTIGTHTAGGRAGG